MVDIMDENKFIADGGLIGKCSLCSCTVRKQDNYLSKGTININGKRVCGRCLYSLVNPVKRAETLYAQEIKDTGKKELQIEQYGVWVNPETGKIEKA
jgi:hypothetical protein